MTDAEQYAKDVAARGGTTGPFYDWGRESVAREIPGAEQVTVAPAAEETLSAVGWRVLVAMPPAKKQTEGGLYKPDRTTEMESIASMVGEVVDVGEYCYPKDKYPNGPWCKVGDFVIFRSYSGTKLKFCGRDFRLLNDDAIEAVTNAPHLIEKG